jgi:hypothetical protein
MRGSIMTSEDMMPSIDRLCEAVTTTILQKKKSLTVDDKFTLDYRRRP